MRVLLTNEAYRRWGDRLAEIAPGAEWLVMGDDGSLALGGEPVDARDAAPEVAWATSDIYQSRILRPFFGMVRHAGSMRWFQSAAAGTDHPIFAEIVARGVRLTNSHVTAEPIAEYVLRAVLDVFQDAGRWRDAQAARRWEVHDFREVNGSTWLIIGYGHIGSAIGERARAFGADVVGVRRTPGPHTVTPDRIAEVLPAADVVVLAAPATDQTSGLVDATFLAAMQERSVLVNIARGALVDEDALLAALDRGVPDAAILDVTATEPLPADSPLWDHPGVVLTPHSSALGDGRFERAADTFADNLARYVRGEPLVNEIHDPATGS
jgi:phosphoglycerate dehydrogenase-like enzyme